MSTSKLSPRFVEKEVKTVESVRDGVTLNLSDDEARMLMALVGRTTGIGLYEIYQALHKEYGESGYECVPSYGGGSLPSIRIQAA